MGGKERAAIIAARSASTAAIKRVQSNAEPIVAKLRQDLSYVSHAALTLPREQLAEVADQAVALRQTVEGMLQEAQLPQTEQSAGKKERRVALRSKDSKDSGGGGGGDGGSAVNGTVLLRCACGRLAQQLEGPARVLQPAGHAQVARGGRHALHFALYRVLHILYSLRTLCNRYDSNWLNGSSRARRLGAGVITSRLTGASC